ncbi:MAG: hypothetical protein AVDCRST_MAG77-2528 [uncultured Chloroflexi bacterium]|uniref:HTH luxR-type domain-containing protein n=1 Tax=uncultured Chloroflexota bacterium TaxID=166587 RepID=A0A6J4IU59_9CHLR|nr:MAG: hypothetical protein AVDCRST_MAG77-2528 [uncultured Chloroflexota bacterium]
MLQLAAESHSNSDIAARLSRSPRTVEMHRANLMRKLGLQNPADLILYAVRRGLIDVGRDEYGAGDRPNTVPIR